MIEKYIGIMSGTSLDGVDIALCQIDRKSCILEAFYNVAFDLELKREILELINTEIPLSRVGEVDCKLGKFFAKCVNDFIENSSLDRDSIIAIALHGQTVWHEPNGECPFTIQLGNASVLAVETGIEVISDFRSKDIALGGQGAPFAPAFHQFLFGHLEKCVVLNIGGMANISVLGESTIGYDTGCGNVLMDLWISEHQGMAYDENGEWAKSGKVNHQLLEQMLQDEYFLLKFPKSTGREYFNKNFLIKYLDVCVKMPPEDVQATLLALTVESISNEVKQFNPKKLLVCGGGVRNLYLMEQLSKALPNTEISSTKKYGINADNMEAMIFSWLAYKRLKNEEVELKTVTNARKNTVLGAIYASH